jgi:hypothetical protein
MLGGEKKSTTFRFWEQKQSFDISFFVTICQAYLTPGRENKESYHTIAATELYIIKDSSYGGVF